ncbi:MAG: trypsin-like peptidase domain-containing protein [Actinomycetota bacterium]
MESPTQPRPATDHAASMGATAQGAVPAADPTSPGTSTAPSTGVTTGAPAGTSTWEFEQVAPTGPPQRPRTGTGVAGTEGALAPPITPATEVGATTGPDPVPVRHGWGWRALVAFVAGGMLTGGGFAIGQLAGGDGSTDAGAAPTSTVAVTVPSTNTVPAPSLVPLPDDGELEPAEFVADLLSPSVVQVNTTTGAGSGVVYADSLIITNHHVISGFDEVSILTKDGRTIDGEVLGSDPNADIAVIQIPANENLPVAALAIDDPPAVGSTAIAIGSPFRLQQTVTEGIVSAVNRPVPSQSRQTYTAMIQTDAPINPGNSGGALADRFGRVIGINTAIQTGGLSQTNAGVGFAVPIDTAVSVAERIVAGEEINNGFLGIEGGSSSDGSAGVEITGVTPDSAAAEAGLAVGDLVLSIDGAPVTQFEELAGLIVAKRPGDLVDLEVIRDGERLVITATLGTRS